MKKMFLSAFALLFLIIFLLSCTYDKEVLVSPSGCSDTLDISFSGKVQSILRENCFACHGNGSRFGNVSLETYDNVKALAINGSLLGSVSQDGRFAAMPLGASKLDECSIKSVKKWIEEGSKNN